jgi:hypothetical protein
MEIISGETIREMNTTLNESFLSETIRSYMWFFFVTLLFVICFGWLTEIGNEMFYRYILVWWFVRIFFVFINKSSIIEIKIRYFYQIVQNTINQNIYLLIFLFC